MFKTNDTLELTEFKEEFDFGVIHRLESWRSQSKAAQRQRLNKVWTDPDDVEKGEKASKPVVSTGGRAVTDARRTSW